MALPSFPGIFHRLPAGLTEVTRAWGGGGQAQACPRGSGPPPRPRPTLRPLLSSHLRQALLLCPDHLLWHMACRVPVWSLWPPWSTAAVPHCSWCETWAEQGTELS